MLSVAGLGTLLRAVAAALMLLPVLVIVWTSFFSQEILSFPPEGYTLGWYVNAWQQQQFRSSFFTSLQVAVTATCISVVIGMAASYALHRGRIPGSGMISAALLLPLTIPGIVLGTALYVYFIQIDNLTGMRLVATPTGLVAGHVLITVPWVTRLIAASLHGIDSQAEEAAMTLGARPLTVFWRVTLPGMRSGVVAGALFSFIQSFENLEMTLLLAGPGSSTLPVEMMNYLNFRMDPTLAAVATVQIVIICVLMVITDRFVKLSRVVA